MGSRTGKSYCIIDTGIFSITYGLPIQIAVLVKNNETSASDVFEFYINVPPQAGTFILNPTAGRSLDTSFEAIFTNWDDTPYEKARFNPKYRIEYESPYDSSRVLVRYPEEIAYNSNNTYSITGIVFPVISSSEVTLKVYLVSEDTYNAQNETMFEVRIRPPSSFVTSDEITILNSYETVLSTFTDFSTMQNVLKFSTTLSNMYKRYTYASHPSNLCFSDL